MTGSPKKTQALSLLENILEETQNEAALEQKRLDEELKRKEEAARVAAEEAEQQRRLDIARRLEEEESRRAAAIERRTAALQLMKMDELREKGLLPEVEAAPAPKVETVRPVDNTAAVLAAQKARSSRNTMFALAALAVACIGAGGGAYWYMNREVVDVSMFAKAQPLVEVASADVANVAFEPIPEPIIIPAAATEAPAARRSGGARSNAAATTPARGSIRDSLGGRIGRRE